MGRKSDLKTKTRSGLAFFVLLLLLVAVGSNAYLGYLFVQVHSNHSDRVDSFCAISPKIDCVTVAESQYSSFFGVPLAFVALEYYSLSFVLALAAFLGWWNLRRWESWTFLLMLLAFPVSVLMAWISWAKIHSMCILCTAVYSVNFVLLAFLLVSNLGRLKNLFKEAPMELRNRLSSNSVRVVCVILVGFFVSQFFWLPNLVDDTTAHSKLHGDGWKELATDKLHMGPNDAPIQIEEFTDFECPVCARAHEIMLALLERYPNKIHFRHRDYPLDQKCNRMLERRFHQNACDAAYYARCAAEQGSFWSFGAALFRNQQQLNPTDLQNHAKDLGLDVPRLIACVDRRETKQSVLEDVEEGIRRGLTGTPTLFVNGEKIVGLHDLPFWEYKLGALFK
ncbi:MAG: thioredoxin domain-containing protein [Pseudomonadota bacterium]